MTTLILHHYEGSPFAEKARLMLGYKGLDWQSVFVPNILPKPDVVALTGGYRRTPFLQVGADVYCDTALIAHVLEDLKPAPTLFPASAPLAVPFSQWADSTLFWTVIPYAMQPAGVAAVFSGVPVDAMKAFAADRRPFTAGMVRRTLEDATVELKQHLAALDAQLADGRRHLFGDAASIADFSVAHGLWFVRRAAPVAGVLAPYGHVVGWLDRMLAIGHGRSSRLDSGAAIAIAAAAREHAPTAVEAGLGFENGAAGTVMPIDYGRDPVPGTLVGLSAREVVLRRSDERAGTVHVHFPRQGFQIKQETAA